MKVVLDTNVWISAYLWGGPPRDVIVAVHSSGGELLVNVEIIEEIRRVLSEPKFAVRLTLGGWTVPTMVRSIRRLSTHVADQGTSVRIPADPSDEKFLGAAIAGRADAIVSGDRHLLALGAVEGIPILTSQQFLRWLPVR